MLNIAAYRFVSLPDPASWVVPLRERCTSLALKGTIIVAPEGINLFVAGDAASIDAWLAWLATDPLFVDGDGSQALARLDVKRSWSGTKPFRRLRVKLKPEIVTMRKPGVRPDRERAAAVEPTRLAAWLAQGHDDDGRPVRLLDTRNAFEVFHGSFEGADHLGLTRFDGFPAAVAALPEALKDETLVTFCTGGIRCEKAALYLRDAGFDRVLQLDGGILRYFAEVGDAHWRGECFVFDERIALTADLRSGMEVG